MSITKILQLSQLFPNDQREKCGHQENKIEWSWLQRCWRPSQIRLFIDPFSGSISLCQGIGPDLPETKLGDIRFSFDFFANALVLTWSLTSKDYGNTLTTSGGTYISTKAHKANIHRNNFREKDWTLSKRMFFRVLWCNKCRPILKQTYPSKANEIALKDKRIVCTMVGHMNVDEQMFDGFEL